MRIYFHRCEWLRMEMFNCQMSVEVSIYWKGTAYFTTLATATCSSHQIIRRLQIRYINPIVYIEWLRKCAVQRKLFMTWNLFCFEVECLLSVISHIKFILIMYHVYNACVNICRVELKFMLMFCSLGNGSYLIKSIESGS